MKMLIRFLSVAMLLSFLASFNKAAASEKVSVTTYPQTAVIFVDGVQVGTGSAVVKIGKGACVTVEVKLDGFLPETRFYCDKKGMSDPPSSEYVQLKEDESFTASLASDFANNEVQLNVNPAKTKEDAWKIIVATVLEKFDVLENSDEKSGYLRTSWVGTSVKTNTIRTRFIVKLSSESPLTFRVKFVSEQSGRPSTPYSADEQYKPFNRIVKQYDGFVDELITKLKN